MCILANMVTSVVYRDSSFVAIAKSVINFNIAFDTEHGEFLLAARMGNIVMDMFLADFLTGNGPLVYQCNIMVRKTFNKRLNIFNNIEDNEGEESGSRALGISHLYDGTQFSS